MQLIFSGQVCDRALGICGSFVHISVIFVKPKYTLNSNSALLTGEYVWRSGFSLVNILDGQVFLLLLSTELQKISGMGGIICIYYELLFCLRV